MCKQNGITWQNFRTGNIINGHKTYLICVPLYIHYKDNHVEGTWVCSWKKVLGSKFRPIGSSGRVTHRISKHLKITLHWFITYSLYISGLPVSSPYFVQVIYTLATYHILLLWARMRMWDTHIFYHILVLFRGLENASTGSNCPKDALLVHIYTA